MTTSTALTAQDLLVQSPARLDALFAASPAGEIPVGRGEGTVILLPGTRAAAPIARAARAVAWQGKVFDAVQRDLGNLVGPTGIVAIRADVRTDASWVDGAPCVVLDYARTSRVAGWIRDEIREVGPGLYLGVVWGVGRVFGERGRRRLGRFALAF